MSKKRLLFVSPHLDDAILSCGGFIDKLSALGYRVTVLTVFSGSPGGHLSPLASELHKFWDLPQDAPAARREEDRRVMGYLGVDHIHEDFLDCIYRRHPSTEEYIYKSLDEIMSQKKILEQELVNKIGDKLSEYFGSGSWNIVFVPLSIGGHIDHSIVHWAVRNTKPAFDWMDFHFYEDLPYAADTDVDVRAEGIPAEYICYVSKKASRKYMAMQHYTSQIKTDTHPEGIDIDAIMGYGELVGKRAVDALGERIWFKKQGD